MKIIYRAIAACVLALGCCGLANAQSDGGSQAGRIELRIMDKTDTSSAHSDPSNQHKTEFRFVDNQVRPAVERTPLRASTRDFIANNHGNDPLPLPRSVRLVQAQEDDPGGLLDDLDSTSPDEDFDSFLEQAKELVNRESRAQARDNPQESPEDVRRRMKSNLDRILDGEGDNGRNDDEENWSPLDTDSSRPSDNDEDAIDDEDFDASDFVDPKPDPIRRRNNYRNQPYTLGSVFDDEVTDPRCEAEFCRRMWECAGGRCQSSWDRIRRTFRRDMMIRQSQCCGMPDSPTKGFTCPKVPKKSLNNQCEGGAMINSGDYGIPMDMRPSPIPSGDVLPAGQLPSTYRAVPGYDAPIIGVPRANPVSGSLRP